ncbi:hypothetical protein ACFQPF_01220 [Fictibacillus iocasae]|uniref:Uncharacterized protein n=1 Tax=Fictibacillus iocasae TaxID=2715437 RepID=A0ABW2NM55_9BACL
MFVKIHIVGVDILPDPLGYLLIYKGIGLLMKEKNHMDYRRARVLSGALMLLSIPSVFVWNKTEGISFTTAEGSWLLYGTALSLLKLVLVFHVFRIIVSIIKIYGQKNLLNKVSSTFTAYISVLLTVTIAQSFLMNLAGDWLVGFSIILIIAAVVMEMVFLMLLRSLRKHSWEIVEEV